MAPPQATADFYRAQQRRIVATLGMVRREWAGMGSDFDSSWASIGPRVGVLTTAAQLGAARDGVSYVEAIVGGAQTADVIPEALAGIASDGRPLASLLDNAVIEAKRGVAAGETVSDALARGGRHLDMTVHTQVADAGRDATSLGVTARPHISWVRMVNPPCCQRCAVQSGKVFRFNQGFKRHPRCDCIHVPQRDDNPHTAGIAIGPDDVKDLTAKQRKAIADGADFNKTVNDRQRKRGDYLPPTRVDRILQSSRTREEAVDALTRAGYLHPRAAVAVTGRDQLESVVGKLVGATDEMVDDRLKLAASTLRDLTARYDVPVRRLEIGNTAKVGKFAAAGDAGHGGDVNIIAKAFGDKWQAWERVGKKQGGVATVPTSLTNLEDILIHEYGHLVDFYTDQKLSVTRLAKTLAREQGVSQSDYDLWLTRQQSLYARRSREEAIAEAFLDVEANGDNAADLSKRIHAELTRLLRAKRAST